MNSLDMPNPLPPAQPAIALQSACLSLLRSLQNADGGWGFHCAEPSRVEPSCWAIRALFASHSSLNSESFGNAANFLRASQLAGGSWPASSQMTSGSWITSLVCSALRDDPPSATKVQAGLQWLCEDFPRDSSPFRRFVQSLRPKSHIVSQNDSYRGWGWTPKTASWVEPTAFALMALRDAHPQQLPANASARRDLAIALLYDRMCPGGGWNCGNPRVYGVDGDALVLPTCWALLALRDAPQKPGRAMSLAWLEKEFATIASAGSLAVACMTLENYGIQPPHAKRNWQHWTAEDLAEEGTHVLSWVSLALDPARPWPAPAAQKNSAGSAP
jgi:hypothetical protein